MDRKISQPATPAGQDSNAALPSGAERRINRMFITKNTEYFLQAGRCLAVKDRRTETWLNGHLAVGRQLTGGVRVLPNGTAIPVLQEPAIGEALYFSEGGRELITSVLCEVERAPRELVQRFVA